MLGRYISFGQKVEKKQKVDAHTPMIEVCIDADYGRFLSYLLDLYLYVYTCRSSITNALLTLQELDAVFMPSYAISWTKDTAKKAKLFGCVENRIWSCARLSRRAKTKRRKVRQKSPRKSLMTT